MLYKTESEVLNNINKIYGHSSEAVHSFSRTKLNRREGFTDQDLYKLKELGDFIYENFWQNETKPINRNESLNKLKNFVALLVFSNTPIKNLTHGLNEYLYQLCDDYLNKNLISPLLGMFLPSGIENTRTLISFLLETLSVAITTLNDPTHIELLEDNILTFWSSKTTHSHLLLRKQGTYTVRLSINSPSTICFSVSVDKKPPAHFRIPHDIVEDESSELLVDIRNYAEVRTIEFDGVMTPKKVLFYSFPTVDRLNEYVESRLKEKGLKLGEWFEGSESHQLTLGGNRREQKKSLLKKEEVQPSFSQSVHSFHTPQDNNNNNNNNQTNNGDNEEYIYMKP